MKKEPKVQQAETIVCAVCRRPQGPLRKVKGAYYCEHCVKEIVKCYS